MINLLIAYYENIGPFKENCCSLVFDIGKYLIKAPIGSGKSFLFFDAPRYGLYKDSSRNMLNLQCKNAEISLIFEVDGAYYLIKRVLKSTKMGNDSCSSSLFFINYNGSDLLKDIKDLIGYSEILCWGSNIIDSFEQNQGKVWSLEEVPFKNETDLQASLDNLLPPKEVFLSTVFLLQDADNIFEMRPADRLIVLKNVFNLLGIDDAKEKVQEKKKEIGYKLKALQDHSLQDNKFRANLRGLWNCLKDLEDDEELNSILVSNNQFFELLEGFFDSISLNDFNLDGLDRELFEQADDFIKKKVDTLVKYDTQLSEFEQQLSIVNKQKLTILSEVEKNKRGVSDLEKKIENIDIKKGTEFKEKKMQLYQKGISLDQSVNYSDFSELISFWNESAVNYDGFHKLQLPENLKSAFDVLQTAKEGGVRLKSIIDMEETKLENFDLQVKNWKENQDREIDKLKELKSRKEVEIQQQNDRLTELDNMWSKISDFDCPDLCKKCPYINTINKQQYDQYSEQKIKLSENLEFLKREFEKQNFDNKIKDLENEKSPDGDDYRNDLLKKLQEQKDFSSKLRDYLVKVGFSDWEKSYYEWEGLQNEIQKIDTQLFRWEEESKKLDEYKKEMIVLETSISHLENSLIDYEKQIDDLGVKIGGVKVEKEKLNSQKLENQQNQIKQAFQYISLLEQLIDDNVSNKNLAKKLQEDEKKLSRLYSILGKEIVLFALDDYLPILSDIINDYLSQCVDYSIKMQIVENGEKLELDAKILDGKGEREVKSLSGGQKTVLKLVWMLAISSYLNTPLLFLDETINNLDIDTVGKVSEMINNFVKQRTMKFYTVTHNKEIQDMQIWDDVIEVV